jgi:uncharacterized protein (DUF697 family)/tellurite resistance protein
MLTIHHLKGERMTADEQKAVLAIALMAAFADGRKAERERDAIRRIADTLGAGADVNVTQIYQDVLLKRTTLAAQAAWLAAPEHKQLAYEMALLVCDADGEQSAEEQKFLADLRAVLKLSAEDASAVEAEVKDFAGAAIAPAAAVGVGAGAVVANMASVSDADLDKRILNYSILNGALELLPQSWATMAIIPLQMKMVYEIGKKHGVELDKGHIKEFLATAGVGLGSQYIEQFGRKLIGGLLGKIAGRTIGGMGRVATGAAFSFATTYALGQLAKRYYAGGRQMNTAVLKDTFDSLLAPAKQLQQQYAPQIEAKSKTLNMGEVLSMVKA